MGVDSKDNIGRPSLHGTRETERQDDGVGGADERAREARQYSDAQHVIASTTDVRPGSLDAIQVNESRIAEAGGQGSESEKKKRQDSAYRMALKTLRDQIEALNAEIRALRHELGEVDDVITAIEEGRALPETEAARRLKEAYRLRTGKEYDPNDPEAQALLLQIAEERRDEIEDELETVVGDRDRFQRELDRRVGGVGREIADASGQEELARTVREGPLADVATAVAQSGSDEIKAQAHETLGSSESTSQAHMASEDLVSDGDLSFMADDAGSTGSTLAAASEIDGTTRINAGEKVQPTFERTVAGKAVPPGVEAAPTPDEEDGMSVKGAPPPVQRT